MKDLFGQCIELNELHEAAFWDCIEKQDGYFTCWIPVETDEYYADPLHAKWNKKFIKHKKKCPDCQLERLNEKGSLQEHAIV